MIKQPATIKKGLRISILIGISAFFFACNSPEGAARIITEKAKEQTKKMTICKVMSVADCLNDLECTLTEPGFSEHIAEKTELISSW